MAEDGWLAGIDPTGENIVWWHSYPRAEEEKLLELLDAFNAGNACGITVEARNFMAQNELREAVSGSGIGVAPPAALLTGAHGDQLRYLADEIPLVELNQFRDDRTWGLNPADLADFFPVVMSASETNGATEQRFGFPIALTMELFYYNQTWLEELGFAGPPTTKDELWDIACAAADINGDGTGGLMLRDDASALIAWTYALGGDIFSETAGGYQFDGPATIEALSFLMDLFSDDCAYLAIPGFENQDFAGRRAVFTQGSTALFQQLAQDFADQATAEGHPLDSWSVGQLPFSTTDSQLSVQGEELLMTADSPEEQLAAWIFIKWFTDPSRQAVWLSETGGLPARAGTSALMTDHEHAHPHWAAALALLLQAKFAPTLLAQDLVLQEAIADAINAITQGADIVETLADLTAWANGELE